MRKILKPKVDVWKVISILNGVLNLTPDRLRVVYTAKTNYAGSVQRVFGSKFIIVEILVKGLSKREQLVTLCHELVHVDQINRGDLQGHCFRGREQYSKPYEKREHEIEAYNREKELSDYVEKYLDLY